MNPLNALTLKDFRLINQWKEDVNGPKYITGEPLFLIDEATGNPYLNEAKVIISSKLLLAALATPIYHSIFLTTQAALPILKLITLSYFWLPNQNSLKKRVAEAGTDLIKILAIPFVILALEASAIYGLFKPYDGRKLYASFERLLISEKYQLSPCFQPYPQRHLLGGDLLERNAY